MPARPPAIDNEAEAFARINARLRTIDDSLRDRLLPPGFVITIVGGNLVITSPAGTTSTLVFT